ncbi:MAG: hypothetical protein P9M00_10980 [Candidatus Tritonobacter lacicola]|nr:hypothetical protein [Candidatus Tritonobacter lacicola]
MNTADMRNGEPGIFPVGDVRIACRVYGEGHPLLLIAGFGGTMGIWAPPGY